MVVLPVRNEAERLGRALAALAGQRPLAGGSGLADFEVLLLANNCDDGSARMARRFAGRHGGLRLQVAEATLPPESAHIGFVRRELMNEAWRRLARAGHADPVIASTDGDTRVDAHWLAANLAEIDAGADVVGGRILIDDETPPTTSALRRRRLDTAHSLLRCRVADRLDPDPANPWPHHHQHFGASLAVRAAAYAQVGGVPPVRHLEDDALVRALEQADFRVRRSPRVRVTTSGRLDGRADIGLSWQLRQWIGDEDGEPLVEPVETFVSAMRAKAELRDWCQPRTGSLPHRLAVSLTAPALRLPGSLPPSLPRLAGWLGIDAGELSDAVRQSDGFGSLWARLDDARLSRLEQQRRTVRRAVAVSQLRGWLRRHREPAAAAA